MERLQSNMLIHGYYYKFKKNVNMDNSLELDAIIEIYKSYFQQCFDMRVDEKLKEILSSIPELCEIKNYYSIEDGSIVSLPENTIRYLCGSNGTCAGNSKEEAISQGICELLERYALKKIHCDFSYIGQFPSVSRNLYSNTYAYKLLLEIENKGYTVEVKDCTLGGKIPVLGIIIFNKNKTRYKFAIGSDLNFDICLQRCITEVFQGKNFDLTFRKSMIPINNDNIRGENCWSNKGPHNEYIKSVIDGSGAHVYE